MYETVKDCGEEGRNGDDEEDLKEQECEITLLHRELHLHLREEHEPGKQRLGKHTLGSCQANVSNFDREDYLFTCGSC